MDVRAFRVSVPESAEDEAAGALWELGTLGVEVLKGSATTTDEIVDVLMDAAVDESPPLDVLLANAKNLQREKWDWALPDNLLRKAYASLNLNLEEALAWVRDLQPRADD